MTVRSDMSAPPTRRQVTYAFVSVVAGLLAVGAMVAFGTPILAVFAVGAGHVALGRTQARQSTPRLLAAIGLALGYGLAIWGLLLLFGV